MQLPSANIDVFDTIKILLHILNITVLILVSHMLNATLYVSLFSSKF